MVKRLSFVVVLLLVIFGGVFGWWYHQQQQKAAARKPPPPAVVAVTEVREETWPSYLNAVGSLVAVAGIDVTNEVPGKVSALRFESGAVAKEGQLLIELDATAEGRSRNAATSPTAICPKQQQSVPKTGLTTRLTAESDR
jgi:membrane fusion protein (multidrug efflux system)